jgi:hypothetical protein
MAERILGGRSMFWTDEELSSLQREMHGHKRRKGIRVFAASIAPFVGLAVAVWWNFSVEATATCVIGGIVVGLLGHLEIRLKVMQLRLATIEDKIDKIAGSEPENNLQLELSDW